MHRETQRERERQTHREKAWVQVKSCCDSLTILRPLHTTHITAITPITNLAHAYLLLRSYTSRRPHKRSSHP